MWAFILISRSPLTLWGSHLQGWLFEEDVGGGAFYGPKIDIKICDAIGRKWQCSTVQVNCILIKHCNGFCPCACKSLPSPWCGHHCSWTSICRSALTWCTSGAKAANPVGIVYFLMPLPSCAVCCSESNTKERPIMIHRAILGSLERFMGILIENYGGKQL